MNSPAELDVDERALAFAALLRCTAAAGGGLIVSELHGEQALIVAVNVAITDLLGRSESALLGRDLASLLDGYGTAELALLAPGDANEARSAHGFETTLLRQDGERVHVRFSCERLARRLRPLLVSFVTDLSCQRVVLQAQHESEKRFRDVVEGAPDGVVILSRGAIVFLNPRGAQLLGLPSPEAGLGRAITDYLHPDDRERASERLRQLVQSGGIDERVEYRSLDEQGREHTVEISSILIAYQGKNAVLAFARDVTERKRMQAKLLEQDRLTALGMLSAGVAHEINNPLAYVLLNLEYLKRELPKAARDPARLEALTVRVQDACHGADRVAAIVRDLRTFARGDESVREPLAIEAVLDAAINISVTEVRQRARLERRYETVPAVDGNPGRLEQVFLNLLLNAAQSFPAAAPSNLIRVSLTHEAGSVRVEVADNGPGIETELLGRIFEPFFTTKPVGVGTGLGLPICRGIVQTHGGEISVETKVGAGTTFSVTLPASKQAPSVPQMPPRPKAEEGKQPCGRVLIVDDEPVVLQTLKALLHSEHELTVTESGAEALQLIEQQTDAAYFDVILTDLMMPGMTGMQLHEAIRRVHPPLASRIVFMTGGVSLPAVADFLADVQNPKFEKPFAIAELKRTLHALVAAARSNQG